MATATVPAPPPAESLARRLRWPLLLGLAMLLVAVLGVLTRAGGNAAALDPDGVSDRGSRALSVLLRERGVVVTRVPSVSAAVAASRAGGGTTVFVPFPAQFAARDLSRLRSDSDAQLVVIAPEGAALAAVAPGLASVRPGPVRERRPACDAAAALVAGAAELGGSAFLGSDRTGRAVSCYPAGAGSSLVVGAGGGRVSVIGTARPFTNEGLGRSGNAALAIGLLSSGTRVVWLLPRPAEPTSAEKRGLLDLLPGRLLLALGQAALAVVLFSLWRARRLGGVVAEALPVLVRGTETTEGRARLYRASSARGSAADALRGGAQRRLAARLGLPPEPAAEALVDRICGRTGRSPGPVTDLLYGPEPPDSTALVRLATDLDTLAAEVRQP